MPIMSNNIQKVKLEEIPKSIFPENSQKAYKMRCLSIGGKSPALEALVHWADREKADFKKIIKVLTLVCSSKEPVTNQKHVKVGKGKGQRDIYEARADKGHARLFFFYLKPDEIVVCTNDYWKSKTSRKEQNKAFKIAAEMRNLYYREVQHDK